HPITDIGIQNLLRRLIETAHDEIAGQPVVVEMFKNARVDNRSCTGIVVRQEKRTEKSTFFFARVYIDNELEMPIHYEAFDWPDEDGGEPVLLEQYTYRDIRINPGLRDIDFRRDNPQYGFR
ncbi:MAG: DUF1571 domain-containing protein, partial [Pirellulaceae bacterium]|nr:DUF1571 domain-containing protein [Pirellulaceae bacterium]